MTSQSYNGWYGAKEIATAILKLAESMEKSATILAEAIKEKNELRSSSV